MNIRLIKAHPVFFPSRVEPEGSCHSIVGPSGQELIRAGIAVEYHGQPGPSFSTPDYHQQPPPSSTPVTTAANARQPDKAKIRSALIAAGTGKPALHPYARPRDVRDRATRQAQDGRKLAQNIERQEAWIRQESPMARAANGSSGFASEA